MIIHSDISPIYKILPLLPSHVKGCLDRIDRGTLEKINELRLRRDGIVTATLEGNNCLVTDCGLMSFSSKTCTVSKSDLEDFIYKACKGSVYSYESSISSFYITVEGIRIGLGGSVGAGNNITDITSVNIRLPRHVDGCSEKAYKFLTEKGFDSGKGVLVISPPGIGKTTFLRDLAYRVSCARKSNDGFGMKRVTVIDERYEIYMPRLFTPCCIDFISGTDKVSGIERAVRLLSAEIIICDEISGPDEAEKIIRCKNSGVTFAASYHCFSFEDAMSRDYIKRMFDAGVFGAVCVLNRKNSAVTSELFVYGENNA